MEPILEVRADRLHVGTQTTTRRYLRVEIRTPLVDIDSARPPAHVAFVIDRSGSMGLRKLALACQAVSHALELLNPRDSFAVVAYDDVVDVVMPATKATPDAITRARERLDQLEADGCTFLSGGWLAGCKELDADGAPMRCLLLTDGLANRGVVEQRDLWALAAAQLTRGVRTSTFGLGADFDEVLLAGVASAGGGNFYFIETARQIPDFFASEMGEVLDIAAPRARLQLELPPEVEVVPLSGFPYTRKGGVVELALGDLVSGQTVEVVLALTFPPATDGTTTVGARVTDEDGALGNASELLTFAYTPKPDAEPRDLVVARAAARLRDASARQRALIANRAHQYDEAESLMQAVARQIMNDAEGDAQILEIAARMLEDAARYGAHMSEMNRKAQYAHSRSMAVSRLARGQAVRRVPRKKPGRQSGQGEMFSEDSGPNTPASGSTPA
jgi:Ca-activated chloride channel family protein